MARRLHEPPPGFIDDNLTHSERPATAVTVRAVNPFAELRAGAAT